MFTLSLIYLSTTFANNRTCGARYEGLNTVWAYDWLLCLAMSASLQIISRAIQMELQGFTVKT